MVVDKCCNVMEIVLFGGNLLGNKLVIKEC